MVTQDGQGDEDFAALLAESFGQDSVKEGEIVRGTVIAVGKDYAIVDIGYKTEGQVPLDEFRTADGTIGVKAGDDVDVFLESRENDTGMCVLSKEKADRLKVWDEITAACERDELIEGTISARVKGGLSVTIRGGVKAFLPGSQVDLRPVRNLDAFIDQSFKFKVIKFNKKRGNIVLSRRVLLEKERAELKESTLENLKEGQIVEGIVKNLTEYGAFIDLGGIDGLLHITDMTWGRVNHPSELFQVGDHVRVKVLKFNADTERVSPGPQADQRRSVEPRGREVPARHRRARQGRLAQGLRRVHRARAGHRGPGPHLRDVVDPPGQAPVEDGRRRRQGRGGRARHRRQAEPDHARHEAARAEPVRAAHREVPAGHRRQGQGPQHRRLRHLRRDRGGHRRPGPHQRHVAGPSGSSTRRELYQKGDEVEAVVLNIDTFDGEKPKVSLGIKQLVPDPWDRIPYDYPAGKIVDGKVIKVLDFGAFVELEKGVEGLIHVSEISEEHVEDPRTVLHAGPGRQGPDPPRRQRGAQDRPVDQGRERAPRSGRRAGLQLAERRRRDARRQVPRQARQAEAERAQ